MNFNKTPCLPTSLDYMADALTKKVSGDGIYTNYCCRWMEDQFTANKVLLTSSCSHALDMSAHLCGIMPGDEVIMPSYTFSSTANAFVGCGAKIIFVDIHPETMNIDEAMIEQALTEKTKAVVIMHYAGVACNIEPILSLTKRAGVYLIEDAAQAVMARYKGLALGTFGHIGTYSFHETKNYSMGEGGALLLNREDFFEKAEIIREKGTNRGKYFRNQVDKYSWVEWGSSYLPSEINAAYLWSQLERAEEINNNRLQSWAYYNESLQPLARKGHVNLPFIPPNCEHNAHMFYLKVENLDIRTRLLAYLNAQDIGAVYHYVPLHTSEAGKKYGRFHGEDRYTTNESDKLLRLPLYYGITEEDLQKVTTAIHKFFS